MKTRLLGLLSATAMIGGLGVAHAAEPLTLTDAQMDQVAAGQVDISILTGDSASIAAQDDPFLSSVTAVTDNNGNTAATATSLFNDGAGAVAVDDFFDLFVRLN